MQIKDVDGYSFIENILIPKNSVPSSDITHLIIRNNQRIAWRYLLVFNDIGK